MSNSTSISSDLINRRLGTAGQKTFYEPDVELAGVEDDQSKGLGLSTGFVVKMVVLFVAVGGGTYFFDASGFSWYDVKMVFGDLSRFQL
jgi:hypothetical protein